MTVVLQCQRCGKEATSASTIRSFCKHGPECSEPLAEVDDFGDFIQFMPEDEPGKIQGWADRAEHGKQGVYL